MFDPLVLAKETEKMVVKENSRKYYKVKGGKWYGGISSAYCCGCNLRCVFCWSGFPRDHPDKTGQFYGPQQVFNELERVASDQGYKQLRITGNEPTIGKNHLFEVLKLVDKSSFQFILETNGILIGDDQPYAQELSKFQNLHVRVSLKATNSREFSRLTGATSKAFSLQLDALKKLLDAGVSFHPALMTSFSSPSDIQDLRSKIAEIDPGLAHKLEEEYVIFYPPVVRRLKKAGIKPVGP